MNQLFLVILVLLGSQQVFADTSYDETVAFVPPFSMNQNDSELSDLFNPANGKSALCVPTTLANIVAYQALWRSPDFSNLYLVQTPEQGDYTQQIRYFAQQCGTDPVNGTIVSQAASCMRQYYRDSGYSKGWVYLIGREENTDPQSVAFFHGLRSLSVDDVRNYVGANVGVLMDVFWEEQQQSGAWTQSGGHTFMVAGYDYDFAWGQDQIMLKVVNPEMTYTTGDVSTHYDEITMTSAAQDGGAFPSGFNYVLTGNGFPDGNVRGYVRNIMVFLPDLSVSPQQP